MPNTTNDFRLRFTSPDWGFASLAYFGALPMVIGRAFLISAGGAYYTYDVIAMESTNNTARLVNSSGTVLTCSAARGINIGSLTIAGDFWSTIYVV